MDHPKADEAEWVALLEGADAGAVGAAARATFTLPKLKNFGVTVAPTIGTYRFLFGNQRYLILARGSEAANASFVIPPSRACSPPRRNDCEDDRSLSYR